MFFNDCCTLGYIFLFTMTLGVYYRTIIDCPSIDEFWLFRTPIATVLVLPCWTPR
jgi:hypothetical protein